MFWGPGSGLEPIWTVLDALGAIFTKKHFEDFFNFFQAFLKAFWPIFEGFQA